MYLIDVSYFDLIFLKQVEGTRNDKVCRLLNTLVEIGTNAYQAFLNVLKTTGYEFLANQIVQNEEMIRRENPLFRLQFKKPISLQRKSAHLQYHLS